jgi:cold shock CspA family protein
MNGYVFKIEKDKGFGFIRDEQGMSRFFNAKHVLPQIEFDRLNEGQTVTFNPTTVPGKGNGLRAVDVRLA